MAHQDPWTIHRMLSNWFQSHTSLLLPCPLLTGFRSSPAHGPCSGPCSRWSYSPLAEYTPFLRAQPNFLAGAVWPLLVQKQEGGGRDSGRHKHSLPSLCLKTHSITGVWWLILVVNLIWLRNAHSSWWGAHLGVSLRVSQTGLPEEDPSWMDRIQEWIKRGLRGKGSWALVFISLCSDYGCNVTTRSHSHLHAFPAMSTVPLQTVRQSTPSFS